MLLMLLRIWWAWAGPLRPQIGPVNCNELLETSERQELILHANDQAAMRATIARQYRLATELVTTQTEERNDNTKRTYLSWDANNRNYQIVVQQSAVQAAAQQQDLYQWIGYERSAPSVSDILSCLGPPESYPAWYGLGPADAGYSLLFELLYPKQGALVTGRLSVTLSTNPSGTGPFLLPVPLKQIPIQDLRFQPVNTSEGLIQDYLANRPTGTRQERSAAIERWYLSLVQPWPSDFNKLQYWTTPYP